MSKSRSPVRRRGKRASTDEGVSHEHIAARAHKGRGVASLACPDAHRPGLALFVDVSGRCDATHRGACRAVPRGRPRRVAYSPRSIRTIASPRACTAGPPGAAAPARLPRPAGAHDRLPVQRRGVEPARSRPTRSRPLRRELARATSTSSTSTSRSRRSSAGTRSVRRTCRSSARSTATRRTSSRTTSRTCSAARRRLNRLHVRIAVSEAAAWTGRRFFGGTYRVIPNGVDDRRPRGSARLGDAAAQPRRPAADRSSSARRSSARACRCCCAPSRRCASTSRATLAGRSAPRSPRSPR